MRPTKCGLELSKRILVALVLVVALASSTWATIGIPNDTLRNYQATLARLGWKVRSAENSSFNQLIDEVIETFAKVDADKVTQETKRDIARIAGEAIRQGMKDKKTTLKTGITGSLRYRVGVFQYHTWYGPGTGRQAREEWERKGDKRERWGFAPLIALMPREPARTAEARIWIHNVPADAELYFDGDPTTQKGRSRHYTTPALEVGKIYSYKILVRWQKDGKTLERVCTVSMSGGDSVNVNFFIDQGVPAKIPEVMDE
jgi:uncharacterized protein (TIGR03000 family)